MRRHVLWGAALLLIPTPAMAEVKSATDGGFDIVTTADVAASPAQLYVMLVTPARWWNKAHTYSGDAKNLSIDAQAGGCFCEALKDRGSVEHARVIFAQPARLLRLQGALGPLQADAVTGTLSFALTPAGSGTRVEMHYSVGGYRAGGFAALAPMVDTVLGEQLAALKAAAESQTKR